MPSLFFPRHDAFVAAFGCYVEAYSCAPPAPHLLRRYRGHGTEVRALAASDSLLFSGSQVVMAHGLLTGDVEWTVDISPSTALSLKLHAPTQTLVVGARHTSVLVLDALTGTTLWAVAGTGLMPLLGVHDFASALRGAAGGSVDAVAPTGSDSHAAGADAASGSASAAASTVSASGPPAARTRASGVVLGGSKDHRLVARSVYGGDLLWMTEAHESAVTCVAVVPSMPPLAPTSAGSSRSRQSSLGGGDTPGDERGGASGHNRNATGSAASPALAIGGLVDHSVRAWSLATGEEVWVGHAHTDVVTTVAFAPRARRVLSGSVDGSVRAWDAASGQLSWTVLGHDGAIECLDVSDAMGLFFTTSSDTTVQAWSFETGVRIWAMSGHAMAVDGLHVALAPRTAPMMCGSGPDATDVYRTALARQRLYAAGSTPVRGVSKGEEQSRVPGRCMTVLGGIVVSESSQDMSLRAWDLQTGAHMWAWDMSYHVREIARMIVVRAPWEDILPHKRHGPSGAASVASGAVGSAIHGGGSRRGRTRLMGDAMSSGGHPGAVATGGGGGGDKDGGSTVAMPRLPGGPSMRSLLGIKSNRAPPGLNSSSRGAGEMARGQSRLLSRGGSGLSKAGRHRYAHARGGGAARYVPSVGPGSAGGGRSTSLGSLLCGPRSLMGACVGGNEARGVVLIAVHGDDSLRARTSSGVLMWSSEGTAGPVNAMAVVKGIRPGSGLVILGTQFDRLVAFDMQRGRQQWKVRDFRGGVQHLAIVRVSVPPTVDDVVPHAFLDTQPGTYPGSGPGPSAVAGVGAPPARVVPASSVSAGGPHTATLAGADGDSKAAADGDGRVATDGADRSGAAKGDAAGVAITVTPASGAKVPRNDSQRSLKRRAKPSLQVHVPGSFRDDRPTHGHGQGRDYYGPVSPGVVLGLRGGGALGGADGGVNSASPSPSTNDAHAIRPLPSATARAGAHHVPLSHLATDSHRAVGGSRSPGMMVMNKDHSNRALAGGAHMVTTPAMHSPTNRSSLRSPVFVVTADDDDDGATDHPRAASRVTHTSGADDAAGGGGGGGAERSGDAPRGSEVFATPVHSPLPTPTMSVDVRSPGPAVPTAIAEATSTVTPGRGGAAAAGGDRERKMRPSATLSGHPSAATQASATRSQVSSGPAYTSAYGSLHGDMLAQKSATAYHRSGSGSRREQASASHRRSPTNTSVGVHSTHAMSALWVHAGGGGAVSAITSATGSYVSGVDGVAEDGEVLALTASGANVLAAWSTVSGAPRWTRRNTPASVALLVHSGAQLAVAVNSSSLAAYDVRSGHDRWAMGVSEVSAGGGVRVACVGEFAGVIVAGFSDGDVAAWHAIDGRELWRVAGVNATDDAREAAATKEALAAERRDRERTLSVHRERDGEEAPTFGEVAMSGAAPAAAGNGGASVVSGTSGRSMPVITTVSRAATSVTSPTASAAQSRASSSMLPGGGAAASATGSGGGGAAAVAAENGGDSGSASGADGGLESKSDGGKGNGVEAASATGSTGGDAAGDGGDRASHGRSSSGLPARGEAVGSATSASVGASPLRALRQRDGTREHALSRSGTTRNAVASESASTRFVIVVALPARRASNNAVLQGGATPIHATVAVTSTHTSKVAPVPGAPAAEADGDGSVVSGSHTLVHVQPASGAASAATAGGNSAGGSVSGAGRESTATAAAAVPPSSRSVSAVGSVTGTTTTGDASGAGGLPRIPPGSVEVPLGTGMDTARWAAVAVIVSSHEEDDSARALLNTPGADVPGPTPSAAAAGRPPGVVAGRAPFQGLHHVADPLLKAWDALSGDELWVARIPATWRVQGLETSQSDCVVYVTGAAGVMAFDAATGRELWQFTPDTEVVTACFESRVGPPPSSADDPAVAAQRETGSATVPVQGSAHHGAASVASSGAALGSSNLAYRSAPVKESTSNGDGALMYLAERGGADVTWLNVRRRLAAGGVEDAQRIGALAAAHGGSGGVWVGRFGPSRNLWHMWTTVVITVVEVLQLLSFVNVDGKSGADSIVTAAAASASIAGDASEAVSASSILSGVRTLWLDHMPLEGAVWLAAAVVAVVSTFVLMMPQLTLLRRRLLEKHSVGRHVAACLSMLARGLHTFLMLPLGLTLASPLGCASALARNGAGIECGDATHTVLSVVSVVMLVLLAVVSLRLARVGGVVDALRGGRHMCDWRSDSLTFVRRRRHALSYADNAVPLVSAAAKALLVALWTAFSRLAETQDGSGSEWGIARRGATLLVPLALVAVALRGGGASFTDATTACSYVVGTLSLSWLWVWAVVYDAVPSLVSGDDSGLPWLPAAMALLTAVVAFVAMTTSRCGRGFGAGSSATVSPGAAGNSKVGASGAAYMAHGDGDSGIDASATAAAAAVPVSQQRPNRSSTRRIDLAGLAGPTGRSGGGYGGHSAARGLTQGTFVGVYSGTRPPTVVTADTRTMVSLPDSVRVVDLPDENQDLVAASDGRAAPAAAPGASAGAGSGIIGGASSRTSKSHGGTPSSSRRHGGGGLPPASSASAAAGRSATQVQYAHTAMMAPGPRIADVGLIDEPVSTKAAAVAAELTANRGPVYETYEEPA